MSYDLTFWRYQKKPRMSALKIYEALMDGSAVEGLDELPVCEIWGDIQRLFADWKTEDDLELVFEKGEESFQVTLEPYYIRFDCYGRTISYRNNLIRLLSNNYNCHMFDAQKNVLFEVQDGETIYDKAIHAEKELHKRFEAKGYQFKTCIVYHSMAVVPKDELNFGGPTMNYYCMDMQVGTHGYSFFVYQRESDGVMCFSPRFYVIYPKLDKLVEQLRGVPRYEGAGVLPTLSFSVKDTSKGELKNTMYFLKMNTDVNEFVDAIMRDVETYVFPLLEQIDTLEKYEEMMLHSDYKCVRQPVMLRGYYQIALALLNRGGIDDKALNKLLKQAAKNDSEYSVTCMERVKEYVGKI